MGSFSAFHWLVIVTVVLVVNIGLFFWPLAMILKKMGYSRWGVLWTLLPFGSVFGLWYLAITPWPLERRAGGGGDHLGTPGDRVPGSEYVGVR